MLKRSLLWLAPLAMCLSYQPVAAQYVGDSSIQEKIPLDVLKYIHESERQRQAKAKSIWSSTLSNKQQCAAIQKLNTKPFYGELPIDVPPRIGQMGVLPAGVTAKVVRVIDELDALVDLSWYNDRFQTDYHRLFWIRGISTSGIRKGKIIPLRGVLKVTEKQSHDAYGDNHVEVFVLEVMDVSRFVEQAFRDQRYFTVIQNRENLRAKMDFRDAAEAVAEGWLEIALAYLEQGHTDMGMRRLRIIVERYPQTKAAAKAKPLLQKLCRRQG